VKTERKTNSKSEAAHCSCDVLPVKQNKKFFT